MIWFGLGLNFTVNESFNYFTFYIPRLLDNNRCKQSQEVSTPTRSIGYIPQASENKLFLASISWHVPWLKPFIIKMHQTSHWQVMMGDGGLRAVNRSALRHEEGCEFLCKQRPKSPRGYSPRICAARSPKGHQTLQKVPGMTKCCDKRGKKQDEAPVQLALCAVSMGSKWKTRLMHSALITPFWKRGYHQYGEAQCRKSKTVSGAVALDANLLPADEICSPRSFWVSHPACQNWLNVTRWAPQRHCYAATFLREFVRWITI